MRMSWKASWKRSWSLIVELYQIKEMRKGVVAQNQLHSEKKSTKMGRRRIRKMMESDQERALHPQKGFESLGQKKSWIH